MSATTSVSELYVRILALARSIPRDPLRPSLQLSDTLEHAVHRAFGVDALAQSRRGRGNGITDSSKNEQANGVAGDAVPINALNGVHFGDEDFKIIQSAVDGLEAIKSDVAMRKVRTRDRTVTLPQHPLLKPDTGRHLFQYPLSKRTLSPATDPMYFTRLVQGVELSAQGKARSWWKRFFQLRGEA
jgi:hypothetical protein